MILLGNGVVGNVVLKKTNGNSSGWIVITAGWGFDLIPIIAPILWGVFDSLLFGFIIKL